MINLYVPDVMPAEGTATAGAILTGLETVSVYSVGGVRPLPPSG